MSESGGMRVRPAQKRRPFIYDIETRNISFLQTATDLKRLGIENNMFFLRLYNKELQGVDPFDPNLTEQQIYAIINECVINPWYFLRECVYVPDQGGTGMKYQLHRANLASTWCFLNGIDHYLVIPRQTGKTMSTLAILLWSFLFGTTTSEFMFINKLQEDANNNLDRLKTIRKMLPKYMRMNEVVSDEGKIIKGQDAVKSITNPVANNKIVTKPSASSIEKAEGLGRGCTQPVQYYDEVEFTPFIKTIIEAAGPAYNTASSNAKRNKAAYCRVFTSTPGDLDTQPGQDAIKIIEGTCKWTEKFYDWPMDQIAAYITKNAQNKIVYIVYTYQQLGLDEEWFIKASASVLNNPVKIKREIFLQRMRGSSESPFEQEDLDIIQGYKKPIIEEIFVNSHYRLDIYTPLLRDRIYIMGVDCAQGLGEDSTAITILDPYSYEPVAEFKSPYIGVSDAAKLIERIVTKYVPLAIVSVERNNVGEAILDLLRLSPIRPRLYFDDSKEMITIDDKLDQKGFLKRQAAQRKLYGVWTGAKSRDLMMAILESHVYNYKEKFVTENIINDMLSLVRKKTGRIEHAKGFHDDSLFSYLIALYVRYHGKNLQRFGFHPGQEFDNVEKNTGLVSYSEVLNEMTDEEREYFGGSNMATEVDYMANINEEIQKARQEMYAIDVAMKPINFAENFDDAVDMGMNNIGLGFFDELND